jgi:hypothetical protein
MRGRLVTNPRVASPAESDIGNRAQIAAENPHARLCRGFARRWLPDGGALCILAHVTRIPSHLAVAAAALVAGGLAATAFSADPERPASAVAARTLPAPPPQVRTVVVTKTIHRIRHVRVHHRSPAPAPAPAPAPVPVAVAPRPVVVRAPVAPASRPVTTRTSGHGGGGERDGGEREGGGDD